MDLESELIDLSDVPLCDLVRLSAPELTEAIHCVLTAIVRDGGDLQEQRDRTLRPR